MTISRRAAVASFPAPDRDIAQRLVIWPHHPEVMRRPAPRSPVVTAGEALTWNVFRALELLPPAFWLRRFNASLGLTPPRPAPVTGHVRLWPRLDAPPGTPNGPADVEVDVLIETEHAVWALLVCHARDVPPMASDGVTDPLAMLAYAVSWYSGRRACYVGVIVDDPDTAPLAAALVRRYRLSTGALRLRIPRHACDSSNVAGLGLATWPRLVTILRDATTEDVIDPAERAIAARAVDWCDCALGTTG